MLLPRQAHRRAVYRQVDIAHDRAFLDLGSTATGRTPNHFHDLLDHQLHLPLQATVMEDSNVFEADQGLENLARLGKNEGALGLLLHISSLRHLCSFQATSPERPLPAEI